MSSAGSEQVCAVCGRPVKVIGGRWVHAKGGHVAACDLDADHRATPVTGTSDHEGAVAPEAGGG